MVKIVEITQPSDTVTCDQEGKTTLQYNVTNVTQSPLKVGLEITPTDPAQKPWFSLEGKSEKQLDVNATDQFSVQVNAKQDNAEIVTKVSIMVYSVENSDENYTESEPITLKVPAKTETITDEKPDSKWLLWLLIGIVILSLLGVIGYLVYDKFSTPDSQQGFSALVPDVKGKPFEQAKAELERLEFDSISSETQFDASAAKNTVLKQSPEAGAKVDPRDTEIILTVANSTTTMPDVKDMTFQGAQSKLKAKGFKQIKTTPQFEPSKPKGTVLGQTPQADSNVSANETIVTLTIAHPGIPVPRVTGIPLSTAINRILAAKLSIDQKITSKFDKTKNEDTVITQTPKKGTKVKQGTAVKLVVSTKKQNWTISPVIMKSFNFPMKPMRVPVPR